MDIYFVMVPSMSDTTTKSVCSQTKIRAVHATTPVADSEKVMVFAPGLRSKDFCGMFSSATSDISYPIYDVLTGQTSDVMSWRIVSQAPFLREVQPTQA